MSTERIKKLMAELGSCAETIERLILALGSAEAEIQRLRAIVDRLPTTADGVPIAPGDRLHDGRRNVVVTVTGYQVRSDGTLGVLHFGHGFDVSVCTKESYYADPDKAEAARMKLDTGDAGEG